MRKLDKTAEHQAATDMLFGIFKASIALEQLSGTFRNNDVERGMRALARTLNELRRSLHIEFSSRAPFGAVSPYASFEQQLEQTEKAAASAQDPASDGAANIPSL